MENVSRSKNQFIGECKKNNSTKEINIPTHSVPLMRVNPFGHLHLQEPLVFMHVFLSAQSQYGNDSHSSTSKENTMTLKHDGNPQTK